MNPIRLLGIVAAIAVVLAIYHAKRDPHDTPLPFASTDLGSVQDELNRLPPDEKTLVQSYVQRSHGDVVTPSMADPDNPFTARTFGQAIDLERKWQEKENARQAVADSRAADRDRAMAPLRAAVTASVARSEIMTRDEYAARMFPAPTDPHVGHTVDPRQIIVVTVAIQNHTDADIVGLKGALQARDRDNYLPLDLCWIETNEQHPIRANSQAEITCANPNMLASAADRDFVANPPGRFTVTWEPEQVRLADGKVLDSKLQ